LEKRDYLGEIKTQEHTIKKQEEFINSITSMNKAQSVEIFELKQKLKTEYCKTIEKFILEHDYTYSVQDILNEYQTKYTKGYSVSYTMEKCIENLKTEICDILK